MMIKDSFAFIANYLWRESIKNLGNLLTEAEQNRFSSNDYYYLTTIHYMGKPNFSMVADMLKVSKPAISAMTRKLIKMGLIEKVQSQDDKRVFYIVLTRKGKQIIDGDEHLYRRIEEQIKTLLKSDEELAFLENLLAGIVTIMGKNK